jgi:Tfp pilus assembly PilM family ATPase
VEAYKALQCINYQLEIEHLKELRHLTAQEELAMELLHEITGEIAMKIIRSLPEYEKVQYS